MANTTRLCISLSLLLVFLATSPATGQPADGKPQGDATVQQGDFFQFGEMHRVIGMQQHQGRIRLQELCQRPHVFAVGAVEGLNGEITIVDSAPVVTQVGRGGQGVASLKQHEEVQATMIIGASVSAWKSIEIPQRLNDQELDAWLEKTLRDSGFAPNQPTVFRILGRFERAELHVINGACPVHARIRKLDIPAAQRPFEATLTDVDGEVVGIFAKDAVGKITHPATSCHKHLVYTNASGERLTAHLESLTVEAGCRLLLPLPNAEHKSTGGSNLQN